jgi:hypothetical protein
MLERADTSEVIDLNTLALPLYSVIYWASTPMKEPIFLAIILFRLCDGENSRDDDEINGGVPIPGTPIRLLSRSCTA